MAAYIASRMLATPAAPEWTNIDKHASAADSVTLYNGISRLLRRDGGFSDGAILGIIIGSIGGVLVGMLLCYMCRRRRRRARQDRGMQNWGDNPPRRQHHRGSQRGSRADRGQAVELQRLG
ncbi:G2-specific serine/threonine protein kinase [Hypoxylon texense]